MQKVMTPTGRLSFPNLFEVDQYGKYRITLLIPKTENIDNLKQLANATALERWPVGTTRPPAMNLPIKDGDTDLMQDGTLRCDKYPEMKGHWVISAMSKQKPGVVDQVPQAIIDPGEVYAGCYVRATVTCFAYAPSKNNPQSKAGVGFGLQNVQKMADGESFSGRASALDDFGPAEGAAAPSTEVKVTTEADMFS